MKENNNRLMFDDEDLDVFLQGEKGCGGTRANILTLWQHGGKRYRTNECAKAAATVLTCHSDQIDGFSGLDALEEMLQKSYLSAQASGAKSEAIEVLNLSKVLADIRQLDTSVNFELREKLQIACNLYRSTQSNPDQMLFFRKKALSYVLEKKYAHAEYVYRFLLMAGFEPSGTSCHLTRVMLLTNRITQAGEFVERAWAVRAKAPDYVTARILFFKITLNMLKDIDTSRDMALLEDLINNPEYRLGWTIEPVLEHLKTELGNEKYTALHRISKNIQGDVYVT